MSTEEKDRMIQFLSEKVIKAAGEIEKLENVITDLAFDLGKITVCTNIKKAQELAYQAIRNAKDKV